MLENWKQAQWITVIFVWMCCYECNHVKQRQHKHKPHHQTRQHCHLQWLSVPKLGLILWWCYAYHRFRVAKLPGLKRLVGTPGQHCFMMHLKSSSYRHWCFRQELHNSIEVGESEQLRLISLQPRNSFHPREMLALCPAVWYICNIQD